MVNLIQENTVKWCSVNLADVVSRGKRLEASVFDVEAKQARLLILNGKYPALKLTNESYFVKKAHYGGRLKRNYVLKTQPKAIGFIGSSEMLDINPTPKKYMIDDERTKSLHVVKDTVLLSRSGTIGNVSLVGDTLSKMLISEHAMRLECTEYPGYVYTYLKSKTGKIIVRSNIYGAVVDQLEPEHLDSVPIPNAPDELKSKINDLIIRSYGLRDESNDLIYKATQLLIEELQLPPIEEFENHAFGLIDAFSIKLSDMKYRADGSYHKPIVNAIIEHLIKYSEELTTIGDARISKNIILAGVFKRTYVEEEYGYPFLGGKEITQLNPKTEKFLSKAIHKKRYDKELKITENTILVSDRGTIGTVALVPKHWNDYAVSQNVLKVIPANINIVGYLYIYLNSDYGKVLMKRQTYGSVVDMIDNNSLSNVEIPLLKNREGQKQINDLALLANQKRYEAYCLEQEALRIMNDEVIYAK